MGMTSAAANVDFGTTEERRKGGLRLSPWRVLGEADEPELIADRDPGQIRLMDKVSHRRGHRLRRRMRPVGKKAKVEICESDQ